MAKLKSSVAKNYNDVTKIKEEMSQQCKYVASLEKCIASLTKVTKKQREELEELQVRFDDMEQYSRKTHWRYMDFLKRLICRQTKLFAK